LASISTQSRASSGLSDDGFLASAAKAGAAISASVQIRAVFFLVFSSVTCRSNGDSAVQYR
jgi:hypothetical protein